MNSLFTRLLDNAGLTLSTGSEPNNISMLCETYPLACTCMYYVYTGLETPEFHKKLLKSLSSQDSPTDEVIYEYNK